jgi:hypothetical protein
LNDFIDADVFNTNFNDLLDNLWHLYDFLNGLVHRHQLLNDAVSGCWNLHGYYNRFLNLDDLLPLDVHIDNTLNLDFSWDFAYDLDDLLLDDLMNGRDLLTMDDFDGLVNDAVDNLLNLYVDVLDHFDLDDLLLDDRYLNNLLDLPNLLLNYNPVNGYLHNLWYLYDFLNNTRHNDDLLNDLLDFDYLGHLDHLIDDLFDEDTHFLNLFDVARYLHDLLFDVLDHTWYVDVMVDELLHFHDEWLLHNQRVSDKYLLHDCVLDSLDNRLCDNFRHCHQPLDNDGNLHTLLNDLLYFLDEGHWTLDDLFDLLNTVLNNNLLPDDFDFLELLDCIGDLNDLLDNLRNLHNLFLLLNDDNRFLDNLLDDPVFLDGNYLVDLYYLLHNPFDLDDLWEFTPYFHNLLHYSWYFDNPFNDLLDRYDLLHNVVDDSWYLYGHVYDPLNLSDFFNLYDLLDHLLDWHDLRHFNHSIYYLLHNLLYFHDLGHHAEHLQYVVYVDHTHNFLVNHTNHSLIDL